jgi:hypothetical protein
MDVMSGQRKFFLRVGACAYTFFGGNSLPLCLLNFPIVGGEDVQGAGPCIERMIASRSSEIESSLLLFVIGNIERYTDTRMSSPLQHYVPHFMLKRFGRGKTHQIHVFDKTTGKTFSRAELLPPTVRVDSPRFRSRN